MQVNTSNWYANMSNITKEYASVKSSSYKKLLKKHYENQKNEGSTLNGNSSEKAALTQIKSDADGLVKAVSSLTSKGKNSVFNQVDGKYDSEAIKAAVKSFTDSYNSLVESSVKTESTGVLRKTLSMVNTTKAYKNSLEKVGISIGSDNTLTIDEEKLNNASNTDLKVLFSGFHSFGSQVMTKAAGISSASTFASLYSKDGSYTAATDNSFSGLF